MAGEARRVVVHGPTHVALETGERALDVRGDRAVARYTHEAVDRPIGVERGQVAAAGELRGGVDQRARHRGRLGAPPEHQPHGGSARVAGRPAGHRAARGRDLPATPVVVMARGALVLRELEPSAVRPVPGRERGARARRDHPAVEERRGGAPAGVPGVEAPVPRLVPGEVGEVEDERWMSGGEEAVVDAEGGGADMAADARLRGPGGDHRLDHARADGRLPVGGRVRPEPAARGPVARLAADAVGEPVVLGRGAGDAVRNDGVAAEAGPPSRGRLRPGVAAAEPENARDRRAAGPEERAVGVPVRVLRAPDAVLVVPDGGGGARGVGAVTGAGGARAGADVRRRRGVVDEDEARDQRARKRPAVRS
jgi:hypothetical protein